MLVTVMQFVPPPLTPPRKGEGNLAGGSFPSPVRGGGNRHIYSWNYR